MNTYSKFCPNVFLAKCPEQHRKGDIIQIATRRGKENECIIFNLIYQKDGFFYYSFVRADGFNAQTYAEKKAQKWNTAKANSDRKSDEYWKAAQEGKDFLSLGEPIKIGHHSEKRHRALIARNHARMSKMIEADKKAAEQNEKAQYWESRTEEVNLSMPESLEYYEALLQRAKATHEGMKNGTIERAHSYSLTYAKKHVKILEEKLATAIRLWGDTEETPEHPAEPEQPAEPAAPTNQTTTLENFW